MSTMAYEVKAVRAIWDPSLSIPGTNRRGGWRCPTGTRYGGQITDRFGRSCGWGVARRIANQISDIGSRLEDVDDARRGRRIARRERRILARLNPQDARSGRLERGLRGVAERLEGRETPSQVRPPARSVRRQPPLGGMLDENGRVIRRTENNFDEVIQEAANRSPRAPRRRRAPARRQPNGGNLRESEERRMEREIEQPGAPRTGEAPARRRRRAVVEATKKPKAPVKKPEAVVEPKVVKPRRPKPKVDLREPDASLERILDEEREQRAQPAQSPRPAADVRPLGNPNNFVEIAGRLKIRGNNFPSKAYERLHDEWDEGEAKIDAAEEEVREQIENFEFGQNVPEAGMRLEISRNVDDINRKVQEIKRDLALLEPIIDDASKSSKREELARKIIYNQQEVRFLRRVNNILEREIQELENQSTPSEARRMDDTIDSGERSSKPSATTPKPPKAPTPRAQNALPAGWNQGPGTIITHENGDIIDQQAVTNTWFVIYRGAPAKEGFATREEAIAWHKQNVLNRNNAPAAPAVDPIDAPFIAPDKKDIRNAPEALKHQPPKVEPAKFKAEQEQIIEEAMLEIRDVASLNKFSLLVDQAIFNENEGRQGALRNFQKELTKVAEILKRDLGANIDALIAEQKRQYLANFQMRGGVANARTKLNELEAQLRDKFIKLRTPPGNGAEEKERSRVSLMEDIANIKKSIGSYEGHLQLVDALEPEIRKASERIKQGFVFDPDATNIPKPTPADVKKKIKDQISAAIDRRQGKLVKYLEERYPNGGAQFQDMTPEKWRTLSPIQKNEYIKEAYSHPVIKGKNGKLYNAVASVNGGSIEVVFNEINAQGQIIRARIGSSSRSIRFAGGEVYQASMFIGSKLDRGADIQTIYNQHAFLYLSKIGITKAKVNAADDGQYVWARVGFKRGSGLGRGDLRALEAPLKFYEDFGPGGLISNDAEYARIKSILAQAAGGAKFSHQDIIFALDDPTGDKPRMEYVKQWFKPNLGFPGGILKFADQKVGGTPPRRPRRARAPRVPANGGI